MAEMVARSRLFCLQLCLLFTLVAIVRAQGQDGRRAQQNDIPPDGGQRRGGNSVQVADNNAPPLRLAEEAACAGYVKKYCRNANPSTMNNLAALDCLHNNVPVTLLTFHFVLYLPICYAYLC